MPMTRRWNRRFADSATPADVRTTTAVLLVEDDERISEPLIRVLRSEGFEVDHVDAGVTAIDRVAVVLARTSSCST